MVLDLSGNISLSLSVASLFLLVLGLPLVRDLKSMRNLIRHGYLTIVALLLETILVFVVMVPSLLGNLSAVLELPFASAFDTWLHVALGVFAEASGFAYVVLWLAYSRSRMMCLRAKKWMMPTFMVWLVALVTGAIIHLVQFY